jgi:hypothetical protein
LGGRSAAEAAYIDPNHKLGGALFVVEPNEVQPPDHGGQFSKSSTFLVPMNRQSSNVHFHENTDNDKNE